MKTRLLSILVFGALALLTTTTARAVDFHVTTAQELQNALTLAAANGASSNNIYLTNGYYTGNFNYNSTTASSLAVQCETSVSNQQITLDGGGLGRDMSVTAPITDSITINGLTFVRNCGSTSTGALRVAAGPNATVLVQNCRFLSPTNTSGMGLELVSGLNATITNCVVTGTSGGGGTGISVNGVTGTVDVRNCVVATNRLGVSISGAGAVNFERNILTGNSGGGWGGYGAFYCAGPAAISCNTFTGNTAAANDYCANSGGGVYCGGSATIVGNTFSGNSVFGTGGAIHCGSATIIGNTFTDNYASCGPGGGINCGAATIIGNTFTGNHASADGGGVHCDARGGPATINGNTFTGNWTFGSGGGACCGSGLFIVSSNTFQQNVAGTGGGLYVTGPTLILQDNLLVNNSQTNASSQGGGIWVNASSSLFMINNTIFANTAYGGGGGAAFQVNGTVELLNVYNNIIWGNSAGNHGGDVWLAGTGQQKVFLYNDVNDMYGVWDIAQNLQNVDPKFFDPVNGDCHLQSASICLNAGTNGAPSLPLADLDGNARTNSVGQVDLGCYQYTTNAFHPADTNSDWAISTAEYSAYAAAWKAGLTWTNASSSAPNPNPIPANYVTRAGYLMTNGGAYYNDGSARPVNWRIGP